MTGNEVRSIFLEYFEKKDHRIVRSSSLIPQDDPTLLFVNAGMVQFKRTFLGQEKRDYQRATTSQKCVRAGGKHNDLENVGYTARHHTFFEMLGNFSFGDYFKERAIEYGWDLLTNGYGLPEDKLWVSIYLDDDEAFSIWRKNIGVPEERIVRFGEEDNFWAMGDTGPCGPCSEIHIDRGENFGCGKPDCKLGCECDRYLEIWNLVFMQYNRDASGNMTPLPKPSIDTGLGLERMVSVLQNTPTNYETDLMMPILNKAEELSGKKMGDSKEADVAMKVIADHSRAAAFLIGDGIFPSNEGRGYVLRRIMRRAIRYGRAIGLTQPFLHHTANVVFDIMKSAYPELTENSAFIKGVIKNEEKRFIETLDRGLKLLNDTLTDIKGKGECVVPGAVIFKLYDTFGFPVDIVRDVVRDQAMTLDMKGYDAAMAEQREKSGSTTEFHGIGDAYKKLTASGFKSEFIGYDHIEYDSKILLLIAHGKEVNNVSVKDDVEVVTEKTPFYGESGGQVGDTGKIHSDGFEMVVTDTIKDPTGLIIHKGHIVSGSIKKDDTVTLSVDENKRNDVKRNHTATHILHRVLRSVLGEHIKQAGSVVTPERFRFDFSHFKKIENHDLEKVEKLVNEKIRENMDVRTEEMDAEKAFQSGATASFEEKYGDRVRVVSLEKFSSELCGGTHAKRTGDIGLFKIVSESSIASGVRRIEAITGRVAIDHMQKTSKTLNDAALQFKDKPESVAKRVEKVLSQNKILERKIENLKSEIAAVSADNIEEGIKTIHGNKIISKKVTVDNPAALRELADRFKDKVKSGVVVLGSIAGNKVILIAIVTKDLLDKYHAGHLIKEVSAVVGGKGGGRPDMAQAGGTRIEQLDAAIEKVFEVVEGM